MRNLEFALTAALFGTAALVCAPSRADAASCESLSSASLPNVTITLANMVDAGSFVQFPAGLRPAPAAPPAAAAPAGRGRGAAPASPFADLPAFCRVMATLMPSTDSEIRMELWMPVAASWNGKLRGTGNGGLGGGAAVNPGGLANSVRLGYAVAGNNTGHEGDSRYAMDHPEKIK